MSSGRLLLVAAETDLRRSLVFSLEAEGYRLVVRDTTPPRAWLVNQHFDCTVLDQKALAGKDYESIAFCIKAHPVVLLTNQPHPWLVDWVAEIVDLPLTGTAMGLAIRRAMQIDA